MKNKYYWQGEIVKIEFGVAYVEQNNEKPLFWYNYECNWDTYLNKPKYGEQKGALIPAIKIYYGKETPFIISNHFGIGINKLLKGGGPQIAHFSFSENVKFESIDLLPSKELKTAYKITEFDELSFSNMESNRRKWQKINFPEEFEKLEILRNSYQKNKL